MIKKQKIQRYFQQKNKLTLKNPKYKKQVKFWIDFMLQEDLGDKGDITTNTLFKQNKKATAIIIAKENGIIAGLEEIIWLSTKYKIHITKYKRDGAKVKKGDKILQITGGIKNILKLERTVLNLIQRMSGIATQTNKLVTKNGPLNCPTRKTQWGLLDKKAVTLGGGGTHRLGLYDWILIKDNHLKQVKNFKSPKTFWEVECKTVSQVKKYIKMKPDIVMLDNFSPTKIKSLKNIIKQHPQIIWEASGSITKKNIKQYQELPLDIISLGSLTHSSKALDISLEIL